MFSELFDKMFSQRWPEAEGTITRAYLDPNTRGGLTVAYEFSIGEDGPYTGESACAGVVDIAMTDSKLGKLFPCDTGKMIHP